MKNKHLLLFLCVTILGNINAQTFKDKLRGTTPNNNVEEKIRIPQNLKREDNNYFSTLKSAPEFTSINMADVKLQTLGLKVTLEKDGLPRFVTGSLIVSSASATTPAQKCVEYITALQDRMQITNPTEFQITKTDGDELGFEHYRMKQIYKNLPVYGSEIVLHAKQGKITALNGAYYPTPLFEDVIPSISIEQTQQIIINDFKAKDIYKELSFSALKQIGGAQFNPELVIYHVGNNFEAERLTWHVSAYSSILHRFEYFIDAQNGKILNVFESSCTFFHDESRFKSEDVKEKAYQISTPNSQLSTPILPPLDGAATANSKDLLGVTRTVNTYLSNGKYYLIDASRSMFKQSQSTFPNNPVGVIETLDNGNTDDGPASFVTSSNNDWSASPTGISSQYNSGITYLYYLNTFQRNSINGKGGNVDSYINVTDQNKGMDNAYWNGQAMYYGNGASYFYPLAEGLDVAGHEISHGVIQNTANLQYQDESGALNESMADVFGSFIDRSNWTIGETVVKNKSLFTTGFLRDLSNPHNGGASRNDAGWQPAHVNEKYTGSSDNGGVHINSGIPNFAYYKFASDANVGKDKAEQVYYRALTKYLVVSSVFVDCRAAIEQSVKDLYPTNTAILTAASNAFAAVGIGTGGSKDGSTYQKDIPVNPGSEYLMYLGAKKTGIFIRPSAGGASTQISTKTIFQSKPSLSDAGSDVIFVASDRNIYYIAIDWTKSTVSAEQQLTTSGKYKNAAISRDGNRLVANTGDTTLLVVDFVSGTQKIFGLSNPTTAQGISTSYIQESDALEFDPAGENVIYDAFNKQGLVGSITSKDYWDIGLVNVWSNSGKTFGSGKIFKLFTQLDNDETIGNPTFAKNASYILALEDVHNYSSSANIVYQVVTANIQTGNVTQNSSGIYTNNTLSYPSFSKNDNNILMTNFDNNGVARLINAPITSTRLEPNGNPVLVQNITAQLGSWFSNGLRNTTPTVEISATSKVSVNPNPFDNNLSVTIDCKSDNLNTILQIVDIAGRVVFKQNCKIQTGTNTFEINTSNLVNGVYFAQFNLDGAPVTIKLAKF